MKKIIIFTYLLLLTIFAFGQNCPAIPTCIPTSNTPNGFGVQELNVVNRGCLSVEHNSSWFQVTILTGGTFTFVIDPNVNSNDFDYGVWGPNSPCPPTTPPIRCSYAIQGGTGNTGLSTTAMDVSEGVFGDQWTQQLNVIAGQTYLILVDNFTTNSGFNLSFGGTATLDCLPLPIELISFGGDTLRNQILLTWKTATEINNDYFIVEKWDSINVKWNIIDTVDGIGNSTQLLIYQIFDQNPVKGNNYYKLNQVDFNGSLEEYGPIVITFFNISKQPIMYTDILGRKIEDIDNYKGLHIVIYNDGTAEKKFK